MIARIIEFSVRNRWQVILAWVGIAVWGLYAVLHTPVDAIPDLSENQVIVFTDWMGRAPADIEDQITYPLSVQLQGLSGVKVILLPLALALPAGCDARSVVAEFGESRDATDGVGPYPAHAPGI